MQRIIGTDQPHGKNYVQTFSALPLDRYKIVKIGNLYPRIDKLCKRLHIRTMPHPRSVSIPRRAAGADLLHFWNKINLGRHPWLASLEGATFKFDFPSRFRKLALKTLAADSCRSLLPFSHNAYREIEMTLANEYPQYQEQIVAKMRVSHPVQRLTIEAYEDKQIGGEDIVFTLVGDEFYRKGGEEVLKVFDRLLQKGYPLRLIIISRLIQRHPPFLGENVDAEGCQRIIARHPDRISVRSNVSHAEVLEVMKRSHVGLLPSYSDTYGYSVLEAQSAGCPVITTDVRAFPEMNSPDVGWTIETPKDDLRDALMWTPREKAATSAVLQEGLMAVIKDIMSDTNGIRDKGVKALALIRDKHDPVKRAAEMQLIYDAALIGVVRQAGAA